MPDDLHSGVQSAHTRSRIVVYLLAAGLILNVIGVLSSMAQHSMLTSVQNGAELTAEQAASNDSRQHGIGVLQTVALIATAIFWLLWQHRAYSNLRLVGSRNTEMTPGWSVGYWFIPIVNLVQPYQITAELWRKSEAQNPRHPVAGLSSSAIVGWWWAIYLVTGTAGRAFASIMRSAKTIDQLILATNVSTLGDALGVVSCILAIVVVRGIARFQDAFPVVAVSGI